MMGLKQGKFLTKTFSDLASCSPSPETEEKQHNDGPSCYRDTVPAGTEAMHHVAIMPDDYDAAVQSYLDQGFAVASSGLFGDVRFCYIDCISATGCMMEIIEDSPGIRAFFGAVRRAAERWDGDAATLLREV